jgi:periplasmic protein TonB
VLASGALHAMLFGWALGVPAVPPLVPRPDTSVEIAIVSRAPKPLQPPAPPLLPSPTVAPKSVTQTKARTVVAKRLPATVTSKPEPEPVPPTPPTIPVASEGPSEIELPLAHVEGTGASDGGPQGGISGTALVAAAGPPSNGRGPGEGQLVVGPGYGAEYLHNPPPAYPAIARRLRLEGTTMLRVNVGPDGRPTHVAVETSSGVQLLDDAALDAVRQWSFVPARKGSQAIAAEVLVPLRFRLAGITPEPPDAPAG